MYSYKDIEPNKGVVKLIATAFKKIIQAVKDHDSIRSCLSGIEGHSNRMTISQLSVGRCHVKIWRRLEEVITNPKLIDLDCEILMQD